MTPNADGPDTSHWNTYTGTPFDPAWQLHSLKCSEGKKSGDLSFVDRWALIEGVKYRAAYHWLRSDATVADQAANFMARVNAVGGIGRGDFVQLDWETTPNVALPTSLQAAEWADRVEQQVGRECVITYTGSWLPDSPLDTDTRREFLEWRDENPTRPLWLAFYNTAASGGWAECAKYAAAVWQWTSNFRHPSIVTPVVGAPPRGFDMNHVFDFAVLDRLTDQTPPPQQPEAPPVVYFYRHKAYQNVWLCGPGGALAVASDVVQAGTTEGVPMIVNDHPQSLQSALVTSGLRFDDLEAV